MAAALPREFSLYANTRPGAARQREILWAQARRSSWEQLRSAFDRLCLTEAALKGWEHGIDDPELALQVLLVHLCGETSPRTRG